MKKIILTTVFLFVSFFGFAQGSDDWSSWLSTDDPGIKYKIVNWGKVSGDYSNNYWGLMFKNNYNEPVSFSYHPTVGGENPPTDYNYITTYKIEPDGVYSNDGTKATAILFKTNSISYKVYIKDVEVGDED